MNKHFTLFNSIIALVLIATGSLNAQTFDNAGAYMNYMGQQYRQVSEDSWSYTSAVAHGKSARKVENRRQTLLKTVKEAKKKIAALAPYEGDKSLRDSATAYLDKTYNVLNFDYGKIINLEDVAEQSYDAMEAFFLAQDLADAKLKQALEGLNKTEDAFAESHNIKIMNNNKDELSNKIKEANKVNAYHRMVYMIFFKSFKQEAYMMEAINNKNLSSTEQNKNTLLKFSEEGLAKMDTMKAYNGDISLVNACKQVLQFYKKECQDKITAYTNYFLNEENFQKTKKAFDAKKESERTREDVEQFNKSVKEINSVTNEYNQVNNELNQNRKTYVDNWNKTSETFLDKHTPKYK